MRLDDLHEQIGTLKRQIVAGPAIALSGDVKGMEGVAELVKREVNTRFSSNQTFDEAN